MVTAPNPLNAAALGAEPVVYYSGKVFLALIVTLGQKLGAPEATIWECVYKKACSIVCSRAESW